MSLGLCNSCGVDVKGNFCGICGQNVKPVKEKSQEVPSEETTQSQADDVQLHSNMSYLVPSAKYQSGRSPQDFIKWLALILLLPVLGQIIYSYRVMSDFYNHLWPINQNSESDIDLEDAKKKKSLFYPLLLLSPLIMVMLFFGTTMLSSMLGVSVENDVAFQLFSLVITIEVVAILIVLILAPSLYIYYKHSALNQFVTDRYMLNEHNFEYGKSPIEKVKERPVIFSILSSTSLFAYFLIPVFFIVLAIAFSSVFLGALASFILFAVGISFWLGAVVVWLKYEKSWHEMTYSLIAHEHSKE